MDVRATRIIDNRKENHGFSVPLKTIVLPSRLVECKYCDLITFDLPYVTFHYNQKVIIYSSLRKGFSSMVEALKKSLLEALAYFYPLDRRFCIKDGILMDECNVPRVEFIQASWNTITIGDLEGIDSNSLIEDIILFNDTINLNECFLPMLVF